MQGDVMDGGSKAAEPLRADAPWSSPWPAETALQVFAQVARLCAEAGDADTLLQGLVPHLSTQMPVRAAQLWILDPDGLAIRLQAATDLAGAPLGQRMVAGACPACHETHDASAAVVHCRTRLPAPDEARGTGPTLTAALGSGRHRRGRLLLTLSPEHELQPPDLALVETLAHLVTGAWARLQATAHARTREDLLRGLLRASPLPLVVFDQTGAVSFSSDCLWTITGHPAEEVEDITGLLVRIVPSEADRHAIQAACRRTGTAEDAIGDLGDVEIRCRDGRLRTWTLLTSRVDTGAGSPLHLLAGADVTQAREAQASLRHAQKMEAVGRLAGGIAHDFNNLLTVIRGYADIALSVIEDDHKGRAPVAEVALASDKATRLTENLLGFARGESRAHEVLAPGALVRHLMGFMHRVIGERIRSDVIVDADVPWVRVDRAGLEQVLVNMVLNARDAMPAGGRLQVRVARCADGDVPPVVGGHAVEGDHVVLLVTDEGVGMAPEVAARVFEPFFTTKAPGEGTGLGLATAYATVHQAGGDVRVASRPGDGSTFAVLLPATADQPTEDPDDATAGPPRGTEAILVVEDRRQIRELVQATLQSLGYDVHCAADSDEATRWLEARKAPVDLLLTDVILPGAGGVEVARRFLAHQPAGRVLYTTGFPGTDLRASPVPLTEDRVLRKPFTSTELGQRVRRILDAPAD